MSILAEGVMWFVPWIVMAAIVLLGDSSARDRRKARRARQKQQRALDKAWRWDARGTSSVRYIHDA